MSVSVRADGPLHPGAQWQATLGELQLQMTRATFDTWVKDTSVLGYEDGEFIIGVPNAYAKDWLENRLYAAVKRTLAQVAGRTVGLRFVVRPREVRQVPVQPIESPLLAAEMPAVVHSYEEPQLQLQRQVVSASLNPRYTFETFIVGSSNRLAHAVSLAVSERPGEAYNPLFLYGDVGLGKTHLLQAIGHATRRRGYRVLYVTSEAFTNDLIGSLRTQSTEAFREKYRTCDLLLIDDIQFIADKERTQEEFFHTFNALHAANRQVVLSSDRPPRSIALLEERLRSRFEGGLTADIQAPDLETRVAILQARATVPGGSVPLEVLMLIAQRVQTNIRELEGALTRVTAQAQLLERPITIDLAQDVLGELAPVRLPQSPAAILRIVCNYYKVDMETLKSSNRARPIAWPRQVAMYLLRTETDMSLPQIGQLLGGRDHTTVLYGVEKVNESLDSNDTVRLEIDEIRGQLAIPVPVIVR
jgi:chromosomal replication initiator protein